MVGSKFGGLLGNEFADTDYSCPVAVRDGKDHESLIFGRNLNSNPGFVDVIRATEVSMGYKVRTGSLQKLNRGIAGLFSVVVSNFYQVSWH